MNPFGPPFDSWPPAVMEAHEDKPKWNGKVAPFTEEFREKWREWAKKWRDRGVPLWPAMVEAYRRLDHASRSNQSRRRQL